MKYNTNICPTALSELKQELVDVKVYPDVLDRLYLEVAYY